VDSCPKDRENDIDGDKLCGASECLDLRSFVSSNGYTCAEYATEKGYCKAESTAELDVCKACGCACAGELACGERIDSCPYDADNDADNDNLCGDVDPCPLDKENDADSDKLCADKDICPNDASNDVDSDSICGQVDSCPMDRDNDPDSDSVCSDKDKCPHDPENDFDNDLLCADEDSCPYEKYNDLDSDNLCAPSDKCPNDDQNDADSDNLCGDVDVCLHDAENDADGDMLCADSDPCPYDFRDPVNRQCNEERLHFSQLDSLQALRKTLPATALTDDCLWSDARKASRFSLERVKCIRAVQVFRLHKTKETISGSLAITADMTWNREHMWNREHQQRLVWYIANVARVMPQKIFFSRADVEHANRAGSAHHRGRSHVRTVTIRVRIKVDEIPFRALKCLDSDACNFNEDTSALFIASNSSATDFCIFSPTCKRTILTGATPIQRAGQLFLPDPYPNKDCQLHYVYMGIGIGAGGALIVSLLCASIAYCVIRCRGYRLKKPNKKVINGGPPASPQKINVDNVPKRDVISADKISLHSEYLSPEEISIRNDYAKASGT